MRRRKHPVVEAIEPQVQAMAGDYGYELVNITYGGPKRNPILTIMIDKDRGVTADDCAEMSKRLGLLMDVLDPIPTSYQLAVSSPGIERPLVKLEDFTRFAGRQAAVRYYDETDHPRTVVGELRGVRDGQVCVLVDETELAIAEDRIDSAHLTFDWEQLGVGADDGE